VRIEFPKSPGESMYKSVSYKLYRLHNRHHDGQIVLVWKSGADFAFTFHDEPVQFLPGRDWVCIGELEWRVEGDRFVHELKPLQRRTERELEERAERTKMHRAYRERLWE
jgi:hypothetical protein